MARPLFLKIAHAVQQFNHYFTHRPDALGRWGIHPLVKITAALRMLSYGAAADCNDKYLQLSETSSLKSMDRFCDAVVSIFSAEYLRHPTVADLERLLKIGAKRGFPGMLGSLDCMHWQWKNCPAGWAGQFQGKEKVIFHRLLIYGFYFTNSSPNYAETNDYPRSSGLPRHVDLACLLWHARFTQRYQCT